MVGFKKTLGVAAASALLVGSTFAAAPESDDPILIVQNNWTSQLVLSHVVGNVLMEMGYEVEYTPSDSQLQFTAIANGDMHFQVEALGRLERLCRSVCHSRDFTKGSLCWTTS